MQILLQIFIKKQHIMSFLHFNAIFLQLENCVSREEVSAEVYIWQ